MNSISKVLCASVLATIGGAALADSHDTESSIQISMPEHTTSDLTPQCKAFVRMWFSYQLNTATERQPFVAGDNRIVANIGECNDMQQLEAKVIPLIDATVPVQRWAHSLGGRKYEILQHGEDFTILYRGSEL